MKILDIFKKKTKPKKPCVNEAPPVAEKQYVEGTLLCNMIVVHSNGGVYGLKELDESDPLLVPVLYSIDETVCAYPVTTMNGEMMDSTLVCTKSGKELNLHMPYNQFFKIHTDYKEAKSKILNK